MKVRLFHFALLTLVTIGLYLPALHVPYVYDDFSHFVENPAAKSESLSSWFRSGRQETRPVYNLSLALQHEVFGFSPKAAHGVNVLLHAITVLLLFLFVRRMFGSARVALVTALLFAVHPLCVETVAYFNSRSGLLALLFSLTALNLFISRGGPAFLGGLLALALAIGSKEDGTVGVLAAIWVFTWRASKGEERWSRPKAVFSTLPLLVVPALYLVFRSPHVNTVGTSVEPWYRYLWQQGVQIPLHLSHFVYPHPLTLNRDLPAWLLSPGIVAAGWGVCGIAGVLLWKFRRTRIAFGLVWAILALLPTHSVVPLLDQQAVRILYAMVPGPALALALLFADLWERIPRLALILIVCTLSMFAWKTREEIRVWRDPVALWQRDVEHAPNRWRSWLTLAVELGERKRWKEAASALAHAERIAPQHPSVLYNSAVFDLERTDVPRDRATAVRKLKIALTLDPSHARARKLLSKLEPDAKGPFLLRPQKPVR